MDGVNRDFRLVYYQFNNSGSFREFFSTIGILIDLGIIYYLTRQHVRNFFGKTLAPDWKP